MKINIRRFAILAVATSIVGLTACSEDDEAKIRTDILHEVETLEAEVDGMLLELDEVDTIEAVSEGILSD